jgi:hypothetical protein
MTQDEKDELRAYQKIFIEKTNKFNLNDWRTIRNTYYWKSDHLQQIPAIIHKINCIINYIKTGKAKE